MKSPACLLMVLFTSIGLAQTSAPKLMPVKSKALIAAESEVKSLSAERDQLLVERDALADANSRNEAEVEALKKENAALMSTSRDRMALLAILDKEILGKPLNDQDKAAVESADRDALVLAAEIEKNVNYGVEIIKKLIEESGKLTDKYNSLLALAKETSTTQNQLIQQLSAQLNYQARQNAVAQQMRVANALALYSLLPHYTPPQQINMNVTLSDCSKVPALCVR